MCIRERGTAENNEVDFVWPGAAHAPVAVKLRFGLAIVSWHRRPPPFDEHRRPLAPSKFFDVCVTGNYGHSYGYVIL